MRAHYATVLASVLALSRTPALINWSTGLAVG
jgi:hypothetical protein